VDLAARALLEHKPSVRYKPKELYDILMALEVPTTTGDVVKVKIRKYLMVGYTPKLESNGDPGFAELQPLLRKVTTWRAAHWCLPLEVADPDLDTGPFGSSFISSFPGATAALPAPLAAAARSIGAQYFANVPRLPSTRSEDLEVHNHEMMRFFNGKASPSEIRRALFLAQAAGAVQPNHEALQKYCDRWAGMDCSGMASVIKGLELKQWSAEIYRKQGIERARIEDIKAGDVIVWLGKTHHIATIDQVGPGEDSTKIKCKVEESTAGLLTAAGPGVQYSEYVFECDDTVPARRYNTLRPKAGGGYQTWSAELITVRGGL
jgi:hypothetical protein